MTLTCVQIWSQKVAVRADKGHTSAADPAFPHIIRPVPSRHPSPAFFFFLINLHFFSFRPSLLRLRQPLTLETTVLALTMKSSVASLLVALTSATTSAYGLELEFQRRSIMVGSQSTDNRFDLLKTLGGKDATSSSTSNVTNIQNTRYTTNIVLNGKQVLVALDTGSTDLWVAPTVDIGSFNDSGIPLELLYGDGSYGVSGTIGVAPFKLGTYDVPQQAFLRATKGSVSGITDIGVSGLLGLSFDFVSASPINAHIKSIYGTDATWGRSVLKNIFSQNASQPNFIAIDLARTDDLEETAGGAFSIGEYAPKYVAIANSPKLTQFPKNGDRWTTLLESVHVNGAAIALKSKIQGVPSGTSQALLDTGDPAAILPTYLFDAIYSQIPGAVAYDEGSTHLYILPCNTTQSVSLFFGGKEYPIHPLDLSTITQPLEIDGKQYVACASSFMAADNWAGDAYEVSLGDAFLRNVYTVFDFGDTGTDGSTDEPYMKLFAKTDPVKAASQVATIRGKTMAGMPPEIAPSTLIKLINGGAVAAAGSSANSTKSASNLDASVLSVSGETIAKYGLIAVLLLSANVIIGLALLVFAILNCVRRESSKSVSRAAPQYIPVKVRDEESAYSTPYHDQSKYSQ